MRHSHNSWTHLHTRVFKQCKKPIKSNVPFSWILWQLLWKRKTTHSSYNECLKLLVMVLTCFISGVDGKVKSLIGFWEGYPRWQRPGQIKLQPAFVVISRVQRSHEFQFTISEIKQFSTNSWHRTDISLPFVRFYQLVNGDYVVIVRFCARTVIVLVYP